MLLRWPKIEKHDFEQINLYNILFSQYVCIFDICVYYESMYLYMKESDLTKQVVLKPKIYGNDNHNSNFSVSHILSFLDRTLRYTTRRWKRFAKREMLRIVDVEWCNPFFLEMDLAGLIYNFEIYQLDKNLWMYVDDLNEIKV